MPQYITIFIQQMMVNFQISGSSQFHQTLQVFAPRNSSEFLTVLTFHIPTTAACGENTRAPGFRIHLFQWKCHNLPWFPLICDIRFWPRSPQCDSPRTTPGWNGSAIPGANAIAQCLYYSHGKWRLGHSLVIGQIFALDCVSA